MFNAFPYKVKYTSICIAHFYAKRLRCAQTWMTQFYLEITPCLPLLPSRRTLPPFGQYSFYRRTEGRRLSRPGWLVTYRNKVPPRGVEPGHVTHPSTNRARRRVTSLTRATPLPLRLATTHGHGTKSTDHLKSAPSRGYLDPF